MAPLTRRGGLECAESADGLAVPPACDRSGASDPLASAYDPSGIATYSQAGAAGGYGMLWVSLLTLSLMAAVQAICDRTSLAPDKGLGEEHRRGPSCDRFGDDAANRRPWLASRLVRGGPGDSSPGLEVNPLRKQGRSTIGGCVPQLVARTLPELLKLLVGDGHANEFQPH